MSDPAHEITHIVIPGGRLPEQPAVAPQRRERRQDRHLTLVQIAEPDQTALGVWQLRDGAELLGTLLGTAEAHDLIRSALQDSHRRSRGADDGAGSVSPDYPVPGDGSGAPTVSQNVASSPSEGR